MLKNLMQIHEIRLNNTRLILDESGLSRADFAEKLGMSYNLFSQYIGKNPTKNIGDETAEKIEIAFGKPKGFLDQSSANVQLDNNVSLNSKIPLEGRPVPVISWVAAGLFSPTETVLLDAEIDETLPPNKDCGKNGYGLVVTGYSMSPNFVPEDRIYVNPEFQVCDLKTNDLVIVACYGDTEATFKKLIIEGSEKFLAPLNPQWPDQIIKLSEGCRLVGKVVGMYRRI